MSKQCLDIEQMQHLKELGLDTSNASALYCIDNETGEKQLMWNEQVEETDKDDEYFRIVPAYTLQDILDLLPNRIYDKEAFYLGCYDIMIDEHDICYAKWCGTEIESTYVEIEIKDNLIDAAYEMLCWCIENGHIKTAKQYI